MSRGALAIFAKTPGLSPCKTRLAQETDAATAEAFYRLAVAAIAEVVDAATARHLPKLTPYWAVAEEPAQVRDHWRGFDIISQGDGGLGTRLWQVYDALLQRHDFVILVGADAPQVAPGEIRDAALPLDHPQRCVIGPARDGGFYLFGGTAAISKDVWEAVPYSGPTTRATLQSLLPPTLQIYELPMRTDVDVQNDLFYLETELLALPALLPGQQNLLAWLQKRRISAD